MELLYTGKCRIGDSCTGDDDGRALNSLNSLERERRQIRFFYVGSLILSPSSCNERVVKINQRSWADLKIVDYFTPCIIRLYKPRSYHFKNNNTSVDFRPYNFGTKT